MRELADYLSQPHPVMWVSMSRKVIFLKNPKTGSRSMLKKLQDLCGDLKPKRVKDGKAVGEVGDWLSKTNDKELSGFWIFTVGRNPWDRIVSCYHYLKDVENLVSMSFEEFVDGIPAGVHSDKIMQHLVRQSEYFMLNGRVFADYVGRFEYMKLTCQRVKDECGHWDGELPVTNKSKHGPYNEYYDKRTANVVAEYYADDVRLMGYSFPVASWVDTSGDWLKL